MPWPCTWCGQFNTGFSQKRDPATATAAELAADIARHGFPAAADRPPAEAEEQPVQVEGAGTVSGGPAVAASQTVPDLIPVDAFVSAAPPPRQATAGPRRRQHARRKQRSPRRQQGWSGRRERRPEGQEPAAGQERPGRRRAGPGGREPVGTPEGAGRWKPRYVVAAAAAAAAGISACLLAVVARGGPQRMPTMAMAAQGNPTRMVRVTAGPAGAVDLQSVPGQLSIVGARTGQVTLTGQLHWTGRAPVVTTRLDRPAGVLLLTVQCAAGSTCTEDLVLSVPADTTATVRQPAGRVLVTGLAAPLTITAASVDITATGLTSPALTAVITSGHLSATFAAPPRTVAVTLASAQATLRLPASVGYRVSQQVISGYVSIGVPQDSAASRTVTARLDSAELQLLPS